MTSVHGSSTHAFTRPRAFVASSNSHLPRKNSGISSAATPVLSSFAIDLIAQFDNYRVNMRESLQREVEENIHKAKILKEAMKESSELEAEMAHAEEQQQEQLASKIERTTPSNHSNTSLNRVLNSPSQQPQQTQNGKPGSIMSNTATASVAEKRSRLDRIFGRKASVHSTQSSATLARNHQITPHPQPSRTTSPSLKPASTLSALPNRSIKAQNASTADLNELRYLPVEENDDDEDEIQVLDRNMSAPNAGNGVGVGGLETLDHEPGTEVKLHPTRAKTFALPKSLKNLKRRIAALRAKGTDLDAEQREREARERANGGVATEEKKKFTLIRLLPWKTSKKATAATSTA
ncbi:hypothetical protein BG006_007297 [Podila minutissima]|uniref:Uncharacterized protein n=1 Tax=Podila minutissima TaxID=64525 RepID=A0A9P5SHZ5_9FUNG|nr:hypothetical protein BG006_007297 [Podila minutissima]